MFTFSLIVFNLGHNTITTDNMIAVMFEYCNSLKAKLSKLFATIYIVTDRNEKSYYIYYLDFTMLF